MAASSSTMNTLPAVGGITVSIAKVWRRATLLRLDIYANVMRVVTAGNANSLLVRETRPGAAMYVNLSGDRAAKSDQIRAWVVNNNAAESR